mmetsp:Transcript_21873/g.52045  ORF Transcript_21873/g.52045 Transcript_21873/m.52045 type:complete len:208 (-) Transcript_21873:3396-4019(-)
MSREWELRSSLSGKVDENGTQASFFTTLKAPRSPTRDTRTRSTDSSSDANLSSFGTHFRAGQRGYSSIFAKQNSSEKLTFAQTSDNSGAACIDFFLFGLLLPHTFNASRSAACSSSIFPTFALALLTKAATSAANFETVRVCLTALIQSTRLASSCPSKLLFKMIASAQRQDEISESFFSFATIFSFLFSTSVSFVSESLSSSKSSS